MSKALYKFLRKAVLEKKPGADALMHNIKLSSRHEILSELAHAMEAGPTNAARTGGPTKFMLAEELPGLGETGRDMVRNSRKDLTYGRQGVRLGDTRDKALEMYNEWLDAPPGGRRNGPRIP